MPDLNLGVVGNCHIGALIDRRARVVWSCFPQFDGDPMFCALLNGDAADRDDAFGVWDVAVTDLAHAAQAYVPNTAILRTTLEDAHGSALEVVDFAPRFRQFERFFRPMTLVRLVRPLRGAPSIRVRLRPLTAYGARRPAITSGSNHIRYVGEEVTLRLTTDAPVRHIREEAAFVLDRPVTMMLGADESLAQPVADTAREFYERTLDYWREFSRYLSIPFEWQDEVIRAAITLKLCSDDDGGAIVAAMTTSIPEAPHSGRNWDYRYCWLRDAYFVVHALNRLGVTGTLERYLTYITNVVRHARNGFLKPAYGINPEAPLTEREVASLAGYRGMGPVRIGNQAADQVQNDTYGSVILAAAQVFFDRRLDRPGLEILFQQLERLGEQAAQRYDQPDAGLWEFRRRQQVHTFSSVMCWAACDRLAKIAARLGLADRAAHWRAQADTIHRETSARAWNPASGRFAAVWDGDAVDASLLLLHHLGFVSPQDPRFVATVDAVAAALSNGNHLFRYVEDEFGRAQTAFTVCTFWYIDALAAVGRVEEARELFQEMLARRNHVGLYSEDIDPATGELWGNFPQTYSMVGLINSAMRLSRSWNEAF